MPDSLLAPFTDLDRGRARFTVDPARPGALEAVPDLLAGAAEVDITPPPGLPKAGYSANAHDGAGFRTRLRARVLHLRSGTSSIAWVACDLLGGSQVVQHLVANAIAERTDIPLAGLMIGATHTHAGPGQFLGSDFYNRFASNRSGFDPAWTDFLVGRITDAVITAHDTRRPAKLAVGSTEVWGWTRNRSLDPHVHNETVTDTRQDPQRKWVAINPVLNLVRVDDRSTGEPLSAMLTFSVHGTGISMKAKEYNADLWAYLVGQLSHWIEEDTSTRAVVGAVEGTHADVAPAIRPGRAGHVEAERVGRGIGDEAYALWARLGSELRDDVTIGAGLREIDLQTSRTIDGIELPRRPAVGAALVAGAHENLTPVVWRIPPFRPGTPHPHRHTNPQGAKWVIGSRWLQPIVLPLASFPRVLPLQVLRIADVAVVGLPFEITTETGRRLAAAAAAGLGESDVRAVVSSVANEYIGYIATAEEYERQFYEGGHTLYGPKSQAFLAAHCSQFVASVVASAAPVHEALPSRSWDLKIRRYLPRPTGSRTRRVVVDPPRFHDPTATEDGYWEMSWHDVPPGDLAWHEPMVRLDRLDVGSAVADGSDWSPATSRGFRSDDQGWDIEVRHEGIDPQRTSADTGHRYRVRWFDPDHRAGRRHRFVLLANAEQPELVGDPFD